MDITNFVASRREQALLLGDYGSYRTALSRRLLTVRRRLGRTTPKGRKYIEKSPVTSEDIGQNHEHAHLTLLISERAWAHGMHMRSVHSADASQETITGSTRKHIISRFHKAAVNAETLVSALEDLETSRASKKDVLEAQAYHASLLGAAAFEKTAWTETLTQYSKSHVIYSVLGKVSQQDVFKDFQTSTIDPSIRYAAYRCQLPRTIGIPTIARQKFPKSEKGLVSALEELDPDALNEKPTTATDSSAASRPSNVPKSITWRSRTVELQDAAIAVALGSVNDASRVLTTYMSSSEGKDATFKEKAAAYDNVLIASQDAADATKHAIDELSADGIGQGDRRMQDLQVTRTAVNYSLIGWRVGRNRVLDGELDDALPKAKGSSKSKQGANENSSSIKEEGSGRKLARLRERIVLYDATLQSLDSIKDLPGVAADEAFQKELEGKRAYFQALKCLLTARSHAVLQYRKNALALLARALDLSSKSKSLLSSATSSASSGPPSLDIDTKQLEALHEHVTHEVNRFRALVEIENLVQQRSKSSKSLSTPMIENMNEYPAKVELSNLVTYPPKLEPIPVKPLFLDVAWNYIEYPGRTKSEAGRVEGVAAAEGGSQQSKKGWFGFGRG